MGRLNFITDEQRLERNALRLSPSCGCGGGIGGYHRPIVQREARSERRISVRPQLVTSLTPKDFALIRECVSCEETSWALVYLALQKGFCHKGYVAAPSPDPAKQRSAIPHIFCYPVVDVRISSTCYIHLGRQYFASSPTVYPEVMT